MASQSRRDAQRPAVEVVEVAEHALAGVDEVEPPASQLAGQRLRVAVHPEDLRPALARGLERRRACVHASDDSSELGQRGGCLARAAMEVEDPLLRQVAEGGANEGRQLDGLGTAPMRVVPGSNVLLGRLHHAPSE